MKDVLTQFDDFLGTHNGPQELIKDLPKGWQERLQTLWNGKNITLQTLSRQDLLLSKLFAFCDRQIDLQDCVAMKPTLQELRECFPWVEKRDANPDWPNHVLKSFGYLSKELGYEYKP
ncbi:MAG: hypothetical protein A2381_17210 [Bdellovibrionales bacterium RIFOXYB1_FULL_37_110]|nr:MAG: hypothetical protein A2181_08215 [Bdellovibrionales bacterium RIFOXYA1_FULL_38_20]OFZ50134.1 MAG: hypothetical protein A2417_19045 [Bdellovibrionales bacterium RIFOXYC1_FULL_37_79]OFZ60040.1 MAG: hypothetical protein A2381_17210 [Bdellovibrionales bacterium RIFOXYB1_FULL_37_110]OFZ63028.1 MAG: hypothetical protein A2577_08915 [Bdellovibrionales bacterium RIFOXYD1_FULL_36_51]